MFLAIVIVALVALVASCVWIEVRAGSKLRKRHAAGDTRSETYDPSTNQTVNHATVINTNARTKAHTDVPYF